MEPSRSPFRDQYMLTSSDPCFPLAWKALEKTMDPKVRQSILESGLHETLNGIVATAAELGTEIRRDFFEPEAVLSKASQSQSQA